MSMWVVALHSGGGSMVEAAEPLWTGAFKSQASAEEWNKGLADAIGNHPDVYIQQEWFTTCFEVPWASAFDIPKADPAMIAEWERANGPVPEGEEAYDLMKFLTTLWEDGEIPLKPPPVDPEEERAAIQSILGGT